MFREIVVILLGGGLSLSCGELSEEHAHPLTCSFDRTFCGWSPNTSLIAITSLSGFQKSAMSYALPGGSHFALARSSQRKTGDSIMETVLSSRFLSQSQETQISFRYIVHASRNTSVGFMRLVTVTSQGQTNILWSLNASQFASPDTWLPARARLCESSEFHLEFQLSFDGSSLASDKMSGVGLADVIVSAEDTALRRQQDHILNCSNVLPVSPTVTCGPTAVNSTSLFCGWSIRGTSYVPQPRMVPYRPLEDGGEMSEHAYLSVEGPKFDSSILQARVAVVSPVIRPADNLMRGNVFSFWYKCVNCSRARVDVLVSDDAMRTNTSLVTLKGWTGDLQQTWTPLALEYNRRFVSVKIGNVTFAFDVDFDGSLAAEFMLDRVWYNAEFGIRDVTGIVEDWNAHTSPVFQITATSRLIGAISTSVNLTSRSYRVPLAINEEYILVFSALQYHDVIVYTDKLLALPYGNAFVLEPFAFVPINQTGNGTVRGVMVNAASESFTWTVDIRLNFRRGINAKMELVFHTAVMMRGSDDIFVDLPIGHYTVEIAAEGFVTTFMTVTAVNGSNRTEFRYALFRNSTVGAGSDGGSDSTSENNDGRATAVIAGATVSAAILMLVVGGVVWRCYRRKLQRPLGMGNKTHTTDQSSIPLGDLDRCSNHYLVKMQSLAGEGPLHTLLTQYTMLLKVSRSSLEIGFDLILGRGQFGIVYKGLAHQLPTITRGPTIVAVKTLFKSADPDQQAQFIEEYKVMVKAGRHINIIGILGIVLEGQPMLIIEYCRYGSLLSYLRSHRTDKVYSHVDESGCLLPLDEANMVHQWRAVCEKEERIAKSEDMAEHMLSTNDLIKFCHQVSSGMEYLVTRGIVHRDLAARNILVTDGKVLKISDFGLARVGGDSYTVSNMLIALPILWMPPDAILTRTFSEKSDVWSFGVLLWEVFSLGQIPYDGPNVAKLSANGFAEWLMKGHQMTRPDCAPLSIFDIMKLCWELDKNDRPTFADIWRMLDAFVSNMDGGNSYLPLEEKNDKFKELDEQIRGYLAGKGDVMEKG